MNALASLLNLDWPDLIVLLLIVLLLFGARILPDLAKGMGEAVKQFSKRKDEFEHEMAEAPLQPLPVTALALLALAAIAACSMFGVLTRGEVALLIGLTLLFWAVLKDHGPS